MPCRSSTFFEADYMDTAGALVHVYRDGTVVLSHAGVEMGQGIHTKMALVAAETLGVPYELVRVRETDTTSVPNTHPTAASSGTDLNGWAVINACRRIRERLEPVFHEMPHAEWTAVVGSAYHRKIKLSEAGHYAAPDFVYDYATKKGRTSFYFVWCALVAEVELDVLTGESQVRYVRFVQDAGRSLNAAIDIGQLEGAFVQGMGLVTMEHPIWASDGHLRTRNVSTYKIPSLADAPGEFHVALLEGVPNHYGGALKQKSLGEIGVQGAFAVHLALRDALLAHRQDEFMRGKLEPGSGELSNDEFFQMNSPATVPYLKSFCIDSDAHE
mmetsp:Transcript_21227/g.59779  ORF Transcript_21227/g.59779 Transcript_21227/m.59779 type:complete len:328 (+) Transcript_21227:231-1214(+)